MGDQLDITNVLEGLKGTGIRCPLIGVELMLKYLNNFAAQGYIDYPKRLPLTSK